MVRFSISERLALPLLGSAHVQLQTGIYCLPLFSGHQRLERRTGRPMTSFSISAASPLQTHVRCEEKKSKLHPWYDATLLFRLFYITTIYCLCKYLSLCTCLTRWKASQSKFPSCLKIFYLAAAGCCRLWWCTCFLGKAKNISIQHCDILYGTA